MQDLEKSKVSRSVGLSISHICSQTYLDKQDRDQLNSIYGDNKQEKQDKEVRELVWERENGTFEETAGKSFRMKVANGGTFVQLQKYDSDRPTLPIGGGERGEVLGFSRGSRKRLLRTMAKLDRTSIPQKQVLFITLTYDQDTEKNTKITGREYKRHLKNITQAIIRKFGGFGIWRYEEQKRLVGHWHLVWYNCRFIPHEWLSKRWNEITGGSLEHLSAGTEVEPSRSWKGTAIYGSKTMAYVGKDESTEAQRMHMREIKIGRVWGVVNRNEYHMHVDMLEMVHSNEDLHNKVFRTYKKLMIVWKREKGDYKGIKEFRSWSSSFERLHNLKIEFYMENDVFKLLLEYMNRLVQDQSLQDSLKTGSMRDILEQGSLQSVKDRWNKSRITGEEYEPKEDRVGTLFGIGKTKDGYGLLDMWRIANNRGVYAIAA